MSVEWIFSRRANFVARLSLLFAFFTVLLVAGLAYGYVRSSFFTDVGYDLPQPVPFSHDHHTAGLGIDCRYCHPTAEVAAFAGMPTTQTCMTCHSEIWTDSPLLAPIRRSWETQTPVRWQRVHNVPDFVYFDHSIHVNKGIGCSTCHGRVDQMPLIHKTETLFMQWCLDCHRDPRPHLRPREEIYSLSWAPEQKHSHENDLIEKNGVNLRGITNCSACHR